MNQLTTQIHIILPSAIALPRSRRMWSIGFGMHVVPDQHAMPRAGGVFDEGEGGLADADHEAAVDRVVAKTVETASGLKTRERSFRPGPHGFAGRGQGS